MSLKGWVIYNGNLPKKPFQEFAQWFQKAAERRNISTKLYKNNELIPLLSQDFLDFTNGAKASPDFVVFTDKDIYLANHLEAMGLRLFNRAKAIETSDDKIATYQQLAKKNIPFPKTIIAPKIFHKNKALHLDFLINVAKQLGFPLILKEAFGSFGEQVYLMQNIEELQDKVRSLANRPLLFQEFIQTSYGRDLRLHVVGDQVVAAMLREAKDDFRANITAGGSMKAYQPSASEERLAVTATKAIGADFAGVDLLFGEDGTPLVCEVNSNAHIQNMFHCTKINVADYVIDHILETLRT